MIHKSVKNIRVITISNLHIILYELSYKKIVAYNHIDILPGYKYLHFIFW